MRYSHRKYLSGTAVAIALALPTAVFAGGKMAPMEPVVVTPAPAPMTQPMTWTGFYGGLGIGYGRGASNTNITSGEPAGLPNGEPGFRSQEVFLRPVFGNQSYNPSVSGFFGSARLGYDVQRGNFVFGGLIEGTAGKISGSETISSDDSQLPRGEDMRTMDGPLPGGGTAHASYSNLMSVAVRGGPLVNDGNTLLYGRLGMSRAKLDARVEPEFGASASGSSTGTGVNVGLGAEHLLTESISVFAEYNYHDVGTSFTMTSDDGPSWDVKGKGLHTVTMGVNFRF